MSHATPAYNREYRRTHKEAIRARQRLWVEKNRERLRAKGRIYAQKVRKDKAEEYRAKWRQSYWKNREAIQSKRSAWRATRMDRERALARAWRTAHREKVNAHLRELYYQDVEKSRARIRANHRKNPEPTARIVARAAAWLKKHPEQARELRARRQARLRNATVERVDYLALLRASDGRCGICHKPLDLFGTDFDHIIPLARGGKHVAENIRPTHAQCNRRKWKKLDSELTWIAA